MATARFAGVVRQFSTSAARGNLVSAPIQLFGVEGRYAHALYSAASKQKKLDAIEQELSSLQAVLAKDVSFKTYIKDPTIKRREKTDTITSAMKKLKISPTTTNFMLALAENGRLNKIDSIVGAFFKLMAAHRGEVSCSVTTAKPLDKANLKELETALKSFLKPGEKLLLDTLVDPMIVGGMVVNIGDKYVDMSMASKIKTYTNLIQAAV